LFPIGKSFLDVHVLELDIVGTINLGDTAWRRHSEHHSSRDAEREAEFSTCVTRDEGREDREENEVLLGDGFAFSWFDSHLDPLIRDARANHAVCVDDLGVDFLVVQVRSVDVLLVASVLSIHAAESAAAEAWREASKAEAAVLAALDIRLEHVLDSAIRTEELGLHLRTGVAAWAADSGTVLVEASSRGECTQGLVLVGARSSV